MAVARRGRCCTPDERGGSPLRQILTAASIHNAMVVHAAFGGSTNLLLHIPAIAHAAGLPRPTVEDWIAVNRECRGWSMRCPTARWGIPPCGVPRRRRAGSDAALARAGFARMDCLTVDRRDVGRNARLVGDIRRAGRCARKCFASETASIPTTSSCPPQLARERGLTSTVTFPRGNLAPEGSVIKSTAIDPTRGRCRRRLSQDRPGARLHHRTGGDRRHQGRARSRRAT